MRSLPRGGFMNVGDFPIIIYFNDDAALVMRGNFYAIGESGANHQSIAGNGCIAISLDAEIR